MSTSVVALLVVAGVGLLFVWWRGRSARPSSGRGRLPLYLLLHDGSGYQLYAAERLANGSIRCDGAEYPSSVARAVEDNAGLDARIYVVAAEPIALTQHRALEQHRAQVVKGYLFKTGGDMVQLLQYAAAAAVIAVAIFVFMSVSSLQGAVARNQAVLEKVETWTHSPMVAVQK